MEIFNRKKHWETIYQNKKANELSWYQPSPKTSLELIGELNLPKEAKIIDIGGGDSLLVDHLLDLGYNNLTVLDISELGIKRAQERLGEKGKNVQWIIGDVTEVCFTETYDLWHDRAAFHFLIQEQDIENYLKTAEQSLHENAYLIIGTFAEDGPKKCSGIDIQQYSEESMTEKFGESFEKINCIQLDHLTPSNKIQKFVFCRFKKRKPK